MAKEERPAALWLAGAMGLAIAFSLGLFGGYSNTVATMFNVVALGMFAVVAMRWRQLRAINIALIVALTASAVSVTLRDMLDVTSDLSADRSIIPDIPALIAYASWFWMLLRYSRRRHVMDTSRYLDAALFGLTFVTVGWVLLIGPAFAALGAAPVAQASYTMYLPGCAAQAFLAARLVTGDGAKVLSDKLLFGACVFMLLAEVMFTLQELGLAQISEYELSTPYLVMVALIGGAMLHPSARIQQPRPRVTRISQLRLTLVLSTLLVPQVLLLARPATATGTRVVAAALVVTSGVIALARLAESLRSEEASRAELTRRANFDHLTGVWNRQSIVTCADEILDQGKPIALLVVDVQRFKQVNDTMGHRAGDRLLREIAALLCQTEGVAEVARVAGDEFIVLTPGDGTAVAHTIAERFAAAPLQTGQGELFVHVCVGVAQSDSGQDAETVVKHAGLALEAAKRGRGPIVTYCDTMSEAVATKMRMEQDLRAALANGDVTTHLQPIVSLQDGELCGFEALARWNHNDSWVPPDKFIEVAEESGLIVPLGYHILALSCQALARWDGGANNLYVSVNLSPRQLRDPALVTTVDRILTEAGVNRSNVWLEITETMLIEDDKAAGEVLAQLVDLGVSLALDDFGKGHSSLSYLHMFPIKRVKIDKSFVDGVAKDPRSRGLVNAVISMSSALGLKTVAEGIEYPEQAVALAELGANYGQGWLYSKAKPVDELEACWPELGAQPARHNVLAA